MTAGWAPHDSLPISTRLDMKAKSYKGAENETAEPNTAGHASRVKGEIAKHSSGHVPFPTMHSSDQTKGDGGSFQPSVGGASGSTQNVNGFGVR